MSDVLDRPSIGTTEEPIEEPPRVWGNRWRSRVNGWSQCQECGGRLHVDVGVVFPSCWCVTWPTEEIAEQMAEEDSATWLGVADYAGAERVP